MKLSKVLLIFIFMFGSMTCGTLTKALCCEKKESKTVQHCHGSSDEKPTQARDDCCCKILADVPKMIHSLKSLASSIGRVAVQWIEVGSIRTHELSSFLIRGSPPRSEIQTFYDFVYASLAPPVK